MGPRPAFPLFETRARIVAPPPFTVCLYGLVNFKDFSTLLPVVLGFLGSPVLLSDLFAKIRKKLMFFCVFTKLILGIFSNVHDMTVK